MNDHDVEEKLLLNALNDNNNQYNQQQYNFNLHDNYSSNNNHYHQEQQHFDRGNNYRQHDLTLPEQSYEPYDLEPNPTSSSVSTGSMSPEEFLENFELFGGSSSNDNNDIDDDYTMATDVPNHLSRNVSFNEKERKRNNQTKDNREASSMPNKLTTTTNQHRRSKSPAVSVASTTDGDAAAAPYRVGEPTANDILCGQSRVCANHPGNRFFQQVLDDFAYRYNAASSKQEKMCMTKAIVATIHDHNGRFLKQTKKDGVWEEISTVAARDKVSHALRTKVASWKRNQQQQQQQQQRQQGRRASVTPPRGSGRGSRRPSMSRSSIHDYHDHHHHHHHRRRSSSRSVASCPEPSPSDFAPIPTFESHDSESILTGLMKSQKEIYATMNSLLADNNSGSSSSNNNNNYNNTSSSSNHHHHHRRSLPPHPGNHHYRMER